MTSVMWFRRDLRLRDHPALTAAAKDGDVLGLFVLDPALWRTAGPVRRAWLARNLRSLAASMDGRLCIRHGDPASLVPRLAREVGATAVHATNESTPYGRRRDRAVVVALEEAGIEAVATGTPYAVPPGTITNGSGDPFKVYSAYYRQWQKQTVDAPLRAPRVDWVEHASDKQAEAMLDKASDECPVELPEPGEDAAKRRFQHFADTAVDDYDTDRDRPGLDGTSRMSPYLKLGVVHPRQLLAGLGDSQSKGSASYRSEVAWRDFYADVLANAPASAWSDLNRLDIPYDDPKDDLDAWRDGRTGYPIVDAGMRQLREVGWMHNRVRMITASFLTKDLHAWWPIGARHFLDWLADGDIASNNHGWQWVAGTGTDASPYFRVFNPVTQGLRFDPDGAYVRRWVPELAHLEGKAAHEPWDHDDGYAHGYPERIVDHAEERDEAMSRYRSRN